MQRHECIELLTHLKLTAMAECWDEIVTDGISRKRSTLDILGRLLSAEQTYRHSRRIEYRIHQAKFPQHKSLADFNFEQSPLHKPAIDLLSDCEYIKRKRNLTFVGGPGTGKTHLATALGVKQPQMAIKFVSVMYWIWLINWS